MNTFRINLFDSFTFIKKNNLDHLTLYLSLVRDIPVFHTPTSGYALPIFTMIHNNPVKVMYVETKSLNYGLKLFLDNNE